MILVTGATGFVGKYLCEELTSLGVEHIGLTRSGQNLEKRKVSCDLTNPDSLRILDDYEITDVVHLASVIPAKLRRPSGTEYFETNTIGTLNLVNYLQNRRINRFIFSTTLYEVIEHSEMPIRESMGRSFSYEGDHALYVNSKIAATDILNHFASNSSFNLTILRFTGLLGYGRQEGHWRDGVFHKSAFETFYENATTGKNLEVWGTGKTKRDSLYVRDAVGAILKSIYVDTPSGATFNIASGNPSTVLQEVKVFQQVFPKAKIIWKADQVTQPKEYYFDISKASKYLNWKPKYDFKSIIEDYHRTRIS